MKNLYCNTKLLIHGAKALIIVSLCMLCLRLKSEVTAYHPVSKSQTINWQEANATTKAQINELATRNTTGGKQAQVIQYLIDGLDYAEHFETLNYKEYSERKTQQEKNEMIRNSNVEIYPNPNTGILYISNKVSKQYSISISNTLGQQIYENKQITTNLSTHNISKLENGIYYITITNEKGNSEIYKLILTK